MVSASNALPVARLLAALEMSSTSQSGKVSASNPSRDARIEIQLRSAFSPTFLVVENCSSLHAGHNPLARTNNDTHYKITISSSDFDGKSRIAGHRMVMDLLEDEFASGLHALEISIR